jgi:hypothetical protein
MTIKYVFSVEKSVYWAKEWVRYYAPELPSNSVDDIFDSKNFMKKYSKSPASEKTFKDIKEEATVDAAGYTNKVKERIQNLKLVKSDILVKKVLEELPTSQDLSDILVSYRVFKSEGRTRIRRPTAIQLKEQSAESNTVTKKNKNNRDSE